MSRLYDVSEPSIISAGAADRRASGAPGTVSRPSASPDDQNGSPRPHATFTGIIGTICMFPLRAIINACVALRIHPNVLTLIGVIINVGAAWALGFHRFILAGVLMICANIFDF